MRFFENMPDDLLKEIFSHLSILETMKLGLVDKRFRKLTLAMISKLPQAEKDKLSMELITDIALIQGKQHVATAFNKPLPNISDDMFIKIKTSLALGADVNTTNLSVYGKEDTWLCTESSLLHGAILIGNPMLAKILIKKGANIDQKNRFGHTPLHYTVFYKNPTIAQILLDHKADRDISDSDNKTASQYARERGLLDFAAALETNSGWEALINTTMPSLR